MLYSAADNILGYILIYRIAMDIECGMFFFFTKSNYHVKCVVLIELVFFYRFQVEETTGNRNDLFFINNNQQVTVKNKK